MADGPGIMASTPSLAAHPSNVGSVGMERTIWESILELRLSKMSRNSSYQLVVRLVKNHLHVFSESRCNVASVAVNAMETSKIK